MLLRYPAQTISTLCALGVLLTLLPAQGSPLVSYEAQRRFVERAWPGQVRVEIAEDSLITQGGAPTHARSVRAFLQVGAKGNALLAVPTQALQGAKQVTIVGSDGSRCAQPLVGMKALIESPLTLLPSCLPRVYDSGALKWAIRPELGPGRRVWLLERPPALELDAPPPDPVAVQASLRGPAPPPLTPYWMTDLHGVIGAPLLDDEGAVLCVVFRPAGSTSSICAPQESAFVELAP